MASLYELPQRRLLETGVSHQSLLPLIDCATTSPWSLISADSQYSPIGFILVFVS